jgi:hypothetical protein
MVLCSDTSRKTTLGLKFTPFDRIGASLLDGLAHTPRATYPSLPPRIEVTLRLGLKGEFDWNNARSYPSEIAHEEPDASQVFILSLLNLEKSPLVIYKMVLG